MKVGEAILPQGTPGELVDVLDQIIAILNNGRYQLRIIEEEPTFENNEGEILIQVSADGLTKKLWFFDGELWNSVSFDSGGQVLFSGLGDVDVDDIEDGQVAAWNATTEKFEPANNGGDGQLLSMQVFTSSDTWTRPVGIATVVVEVVGGGGAGGTGPADFGGAGGGGGGYSKKLISNPGSTETVTVGAAAGTSSFGAHCSATGGGDASTTTPGTGGSGSNGDINLSGGDGNQGPTSGARVSGAGGCAGGGMGVGGRSVANGSGVDGKSYGGGGSGGTNTSTGGAGASGIVIVYEYS